MTNAISPGISIPGKFKALTEVGKEYKANARLMGLLNMIMTMFSQMPVKGWKEILPYPKHIHGKFYYVYSDGIEP
jgi:hypothetical protein